MSHQWRNISLGNLTDSNDLATSPATRPIPRTRSDPSTASYFTPNTQACNTSYNLDPYTPSVYASQHHPYMQHTHSHCAHQQAMANARARSNQDIIHSMLTPVLSDLSRNSPTGSTCAPNHERVSWERSSLQRVVPSPVQGLSNDPAPDSFQWSPNSDPQFMNFDTQTWSDALSSPLTAANMHSYLPTQYGFTPETSPVSPPPYPTTTSSFQPDVKRQVSPASSSSSSQRESRRGSFDTPGTGKSCSHCHATSTPLWRREPTTLKPLCNACGLYLQQRNKHRPQELIDADAADDSSEESEGDGTGPECSHCRTHHTSVWRRSKTGAQLCNACGVYSRLRGRDRPLSLKRNKIKPRSKHTPK